MGTDISTWLQVLVYVVTLAFGAGVVRTQLKYLRQDLQDFKAAVNKASDAVANTLTDHGNRISRIEGRLGE